MNDAFFWEIIASFNWKRVGDDEAVMLPARKQLATMPEAEIFAFDNILSQKLHELDGELYARACYGPAKNLRHISGDDFLYSRCCVVANGQEFYDKVLRNPAAWPTEMEFESLLYLPSRAYARKKKCDESDYPHIPPVSAETGSNTRDWPQNLRGHSV